jgi:hypothetical protein
MSDQNSRIYFKSENFPATYTPEKRLPFVFHFDKRRPGKDDQNLIPITYPPYMWFFIRLMNIDNATNFVSVHKDCPITEPITVNDVQKEDDDYAMNFLSIETAALARCAGCKLREMCNLQRESPAIHQEIQRLQ